MTFFYCLVGFGQGKDIMQLNFKPVFDRLSLESNKEYITSEKDTITITAFKCYVSNIEIQYDDKFVYAEKDSYHLLDLENPNSFHIPINRSSDKAITKITFNIGIDSLTSSSGALGGDLDVTKGMYWAWQSGYINMKIEGQSPSCKTRKNQFQFHLGGYLQPYYAIRKKAIPVNQKVNDVTIAIDISLFFQGFDLARLNSVMVPGNQAMKLADKGAKMFYLE